MKPSSKKIASAAVSLLLAVSSMAVVLQPAQYQEIQSSSSRNTTAITAAQAQHSSAQTAAKAVSLPKATENVSPAKTPAAASTTVSPADADTASAPMTVLASSIRVAKDGSLVVPVVKGSAGAHKTVGNKTVYKTIARVSAAEASEVVKQTNTAAVQTAAPSASSAAVSSAPDTAGVLASTLSAGTAKLSGQALVINTIDVPGTGTYYGNVALSGWAVARYGLSRVDIYVDNNRWVGSTHAFTARSDVQRAVNGNGFYARENNGYSYTVPSGMVPAGRHTLKVAAIDKRGNVKWATRTFTVGNRAAIQSCIDSPRNVSYYGAVSISGWAVARSGLSRVDIYVDNNSWVGSTSTFTARGDVQRAVNGDRFYAVENNGFSYTIAAGTLRPGKHTLKIASIDRNGSANWAVCSFTLGSGVSTIDVPRSGSTITGDLTVSGWAVHSAGVSRVEVYSNYNQSSQELLGTVESAQFNSRPDVQRAIYPNGSYPTGANSGFSLTVPNNKLYGGSQTITVIAYSNGYDDGSVDRFAKSVNVNITVTPVSTPSSTPISVYEYGRSLLNSKEAADYDAIRNCVQQLGTELNLPNALDISDITKVANYYMSDHPEVFYIKTEYSLDSDGTDTDVALDIALEGTQDLVQQMDFTYKYDAGTIRSMQTDMQQSVDSLIAKAKTAQSNYGGTMEKALHDVFVQNCVYNLYALPDSYTSASRYISAMNNTGSVYQSFYSYGALVNHTAVCAGYAQAMKILFDTAGYQSLYVTGIAGSGNDWEGHAWNMVKVNGTWYWVDATFDDPVGSYSDSLNSGYENDDYLNIANATFLQDHQYSAYSDSDTENYAVMPSVH